MISNENKNENKKIIVMDRFVEDDTILLRYFLNFEFLSFNSFSFFFFFSFFGSISFYIFVLLQQTVILFFGKINTFQGK